MNLDLTLPPGVSNNGTQLQSRRRFWLSHLVRWFEGALRPWLGWTAFSKTAVTGAARAMITWSDNSKRKWVAVATHTKLFAVDRTGRVWDITPTGLAAGRGDAVAGGGFGSGSYGVGVYGAAGIDPGLITDCTVGSLDNFGEDLVFTNADDGKVYKWTLDTATPAALNAVAPVLNRALMVTEERILMTFGGEDLLAPGSFSNPRLIQWTDVEDDSAWDATVAGTSAGFFRLQTPGRLMCGRRVRGGALVFTDVDAHLAEYNGPPNPYSFTRVGTDCGVISQGAAISASDDLCVWMGRSGFFAYEAGVRQVPCEVSKYVFDNINRVQVSKVTVTHNPAFGEVTWFYPSAVSSENDSFVTWNYRENHWAVGALGRTCAAPTGVFNAPLMIDAGGQVWEHEIGLNYHGAPAPFAETGPIQNGNGDNVFSAFDFIPDELALGGVQAKFFTRLLPTGPETTFGPVAAASRTNVRFTAREVRVRYFGAGTDWRLGGGYLDIEPGGER